MMPPLWIAAFIAAVVIVFAVIGATFVLVVVIEHGVSILDARRINREQRKAETLALSVPGGEL